MDNAAIIARKGPREFATWRHYAERKLKDLGLGVATNYQTVANWTKAQLSVDILQQPRAVYVQEFADIDFTDLQVNDTPIRLKLNIGHLAKGIYELQCFLTLRFVGESPDNQIIATGNLLTVTSNQIALLDNRFKFTYSDVQLSESLANYAKIFFSVIGANPSMQLDYSIILNYNSFKSWEPWIVSATTTLVSVAVHTRHRFLPSLD